MLRRYTLTPVIVIALSLAAIQPHSASAQTELEFIPATRAHRNAASVYAAIWTDYGDRILAAFEARTCLPFTEANVAATIDDVVSNSGGPEHPMRLRATYPLEIKQSTLVHELGHRLLWQLEERLDDIDGHETLYLILDRVWADVWGEDFAEARIESESSWRGGYDYAQAWSRVRAMTAEARSALWRELLRLNGFSESCGAANRFADSRGREDSFGLGD